MTLQHLAVIEWESSMNPTVILGPDAHSMNMLVIERITTTCAPHDLDDDPAFLLDHPAPDATAPDAPALAAAWLEAFTEAVTVPWVTRYRTLTPGPTLDPSTGVAWEADVVNG